MNRRGFLGGLATLAMPTIVRTPGLLMPIKVTPVYDYVTYEIGFQLVREEVMPLTLEQRQSLNRRLAESFQQTKLNTMAQVLRA